MNIYRPIEIVSKKGFVLKNWKLTLKIFYFWSQKYFVFSVKTFAAQWVQSFSYTRWVISRDLLCKIMPIVTKTVLKTQKFVKRVHFMLNILSIIWKIKKYIKRTSWIPQLLPFLPSFSPSSLPFPARSSFLHFFLSLSSIETMKHTILQLTFFEPNYTPLLLFHGKRQKPTLFLFRAALY